MHRCFRWRVAPDSWQWLRRIGYILQAQTATVESRPSEDWLRMDCWYLATMAHSLHPRIPQARSLYGNTKMENSQPQRLSTRHALYPLRSTRMGLCLPWAQ